MATTFPLNDNLKHGTILIRRAASSIAFHHMTDAGKSYIDEVAYPHLRHTKHVNTVRETDGTIAPITDYATEVAMAAAGEVFGLMDLTSRSKSQPATFYSFVSACSFWLQTPAVLGADDVYIHHAVDADTSKLHPTLFLVNNVAANAIGKISDFHSVQASPTVTDFVWGFYRSRYFSDPMT